MLSFCFTALTTDKISLLNLLLTFSVVILLNNKHLPSYSRMLNTRGGLLINLYIFFHLLANY